MKVQHQSAKFDQVGKAICPCRSTMLTRHIIAGALCLLGVNPVIAVGAAREHRCDSF